MFRSTVARFKFVKASENLILLVKCVTCDLGKQNNFTWIDEYAGCEWRWRKKDRNTANANSPVQGS